MDDLQFVGQGIRLRLKPSKHQLHESEIALIPASTTAGVGLQRWLKKSRIEAGPCFAG